MNASTVRDERLQMLGPQHAAAMYEIERQCFPLPWSEEQCAAAFGQKALSALGIFRHEALIGYISVYHTLDELEILNLAVLPDERRRGYGRRKAVMLAGGGRYPEPLPSDRLTDRRQTTRPIARAAFPAALG